MNLSTSHHYMVTDMHREGEKVMTLVLHTKEDLSRYRAGQFITVYFPETGHVEGKSYSVSRFLDAHTLTITVKPIGVFSRKLCSMKKGDKLSASLPYGYFYSDSTTSSLVLIAGGIGVAPFRALIHEAIEKYPARSIMLFYSAKKKNELHFFEELRQLTSHHPSFFMRAHVTKEVVNPPVHQGRFSCEQILSLSSSLPNKEYLICGSIPFVRECWNELRALGVKDEVLYTEAFF